MQVYTRLHLGRGQRPSGDGQRWRCRYPARSRA